MTLVVAITIAAIGFLFFLRWPVRGFALLLFLLPFSVALNPLSGIDLQLLRILVPLLWLATFLFIGNERRYDLLCNKIDEFNLVRYTTFRVNDPLTTYRQEKPALFPYGAY